MAENNTTPKEKFQPREYQLELLEAAKKRNIIVCLGTGTGKTFISIKFIEHLARENDILRPFSEGAKRTFFLVNSVPLVFQQAKAIEDNTALKVKAYCGEMGVDFWSKADWVREFEDHHVLVMTHQIYLDLIQHAKFGFSLSQANLLVLDECHHANKNHPFKKIMDCFADVHKRDHPRVLGLTASVVGRKVKPHQIGSEIKKLECTMRSVCRTASDPYIVEKYGAKPKEYMIQYSSSHHLNDVAKFLESEFHSVLDPLEEFLGEVKIVNEKSGSGEVIKKELTIAKGAVRECLAALNDIGVWAAYEVSLMIAEDLEKRIKKLSSNLSQHIKRASLMLETTASSLRELAYKYREFNLANVGGREKIQQDYLKPKVKELLRQFSKIAGEPSKICAIVFVQRRYAACVVSKLINNLASTGPVEYRHLKSDFVTGHGSELWDISETEMNYKKQKDKLAKFKSGKINVLVGTSVVEEGVDIPKCNLVVMFDFPQNYRAFVQSRGRGRAKDAKYVMLVERSKYIERRQEQQMYQSVDELLMKECQADRDGPTEEEINEAVNEYALPNYYTVLNAKLDMGNCIARLYRYCSKLPCDRFTSLKPIFTKYDVDGQFQCMLKMPGNSHITGIIKGEPMPSIKEARQAVAREACIQLHKLGGLDDNLLPPKSSSSESESEADEVDGAPQKWNKKTKLPKSGTKKRRRSHSVKTSKQLYGQLTTDGTRNYYVYAIIMTFEEIYKPVKKQLWDRKIVSLGIITNEELPSELPPVVLYNEIGKLTVTFERCPSVSVLTSKQRNIVDWFHHFIFTETLKFNLGRRISSGCRVVLLNNDNSKLILSRQAVNINFNEMELLKINASKSNGKLSSNMDLLDSVVVESYLRSSTHQSPGHYMVISACMNHSQQQVKAIHHTRNIDCRRSKGVKQAKSRIIERNAECLEFRSSPQSLTLRVLFLPAILYRVDTFVSIIELQHSLSTDVAARVPIDVSFPASPRKRSRGSNQASISDVFKPLEKYFCPFDSSKTVPLLQLLEAVTCANSGEDFNLERLEMLGDSFLKVAVSVHVYWHKDHKDEGKLTKYRTRQISNKNLFSLATKKGLEKYIKYSTFAKDTWLPPGFTRPLSDDDNDDDICCDVIRCDVTDDVVTQKIPDKSVADSMEALIGAHLIHCGYIGTMGFMDWLGLDVFCKEVTDDEERTNGNRRKSPTPLDHSKYADYPQLSLQIPDSEDTERYQEILSRETKEMASFERAIGYKFKNKVLLLEAFTHPSYTENTITGSYQRLEFLGDAILDFLVTQHIYNNSKKDLAPGELTDLRSALVNNNIFAVVAVNNDYHKYLKELSPILFTTVNHFSKGVKEYVEKLKTEVIPDPFVIPVQSDSNDLECMEAPKPLGDIFESVAGAIFLDSGLDIFEVWRVCFPMLENFIDEYLKKIPKNPVRKVKEKDDKAKFSQPTILKDSRVSCDLTFKHKTYTGVGRNKHNAKLSASYKALKANDEPTNNTKR